MTEEISVGPILAIMNCDVHDTEGSLRFTTYLCYNTFILCITYDIAATTPRLDGCRHGGKGNTGSALNGILSRSPTSST